MVVYVSNSSDSSASWSPIYIAIPAGIVFVLFTFLALFCYGRYRHKQGVPYKYWFDVVPKAKGRKWLMKDEVVFVHTRDRMKKEKMQRMWVPEEGVLMVVEEEEKGGIEGREGEGWLGGGGLR